MRGCFPKGVLSQRGFVLGDFVLEGFRPTPESNMKGREAWRKYYISRVEGCHRGKIRVSY